MIRIYSAMEIIRDARFSLVEKDVENKSASLRLYGESSPIEGKQGNHHHMTYIGITQLRRQD